MDRQLLPEARIGLEGAPEVVFRQSIDFDVGFGYAGGVARRLGDQSLLAEEAAFVDYRDRGERRG